MTLHHCEAEGGYMVELNTPEEEKIISQTVTLYLV
jgi:hypothetical protein